MQTHLRVAVVQMAPVFMDRAATLAKMIERLREAAAGGAELVVFGEALVPGYPVWTERTDGARFESELQKELHALYLEQAVQIEAGHLEALCEAARAAEVCVSMSVIERPPERGSSLYCSSLFLSPAGRIESVHRKLVPTYEERLSWAPGDGHGLVVHPVGPFRLGALNCWENWMPLARAALMAGGETLHVAHWPGGGHNTGLITPFGAREGRSYFLSACGLLRGQDLPADFPERARVVQGEDELLLNGGSCIAGPDGQWVVEPVVGREAILCAELDAQAVRRERQNFDPMGHYSRPDVLRLVVDRRRQRPAEFLDEGPR